jgi:hypothetical protein
MKYIEKNYYFKKQLTLSFRRGRERNRETERKRGI